MTTTTVMIPQEARTSTRTMQKMRMMMMMISSALRIQAVIMTAKMAVTVRISHLPRGRNDLVPSYTFLHYSHLVIALCFSL